MSDVHDFASDASSIALSLPISAGLSAEELRRQTFLKPGDGILNFFFQQDPSAASVPSSLYDSSDFDSPREVADCDAESCSVSSVSASASVSVSALSQRPLTRRTATLLTTKPVSIQMDKPSNRAGNARNSRQSTGSMENSNPNVGSATKGKQAAQTANTANTITNAQKGRNAAAGRKSLQLSKTLQPSDLSSLTSERAAKRRISTIQTVNNEQTAAQTPVDAPSSDSVNQLSRALEANKILYYWRLLSVKGRMMEICDQKLKEQKDKYYSQIKGLQNELTLWAETNHAEMEELKKKLNEAEQERESQEAQRKEREEAQKREESAELIELRSMKSEMQRVKSEYDQLFANYQRERELNERQLAELENLKEMRKNEEKLRKRLHEQIQELKGNIRVALRMKPASAEALASSNNQGLEYHKVKEGLEQAAGFSEYLEVVAPFGTNLDGTISQKREKSQFAFDRVFGPQTSQSEVFQEVADLIVSALDGHHVTIFAYGQSGSGKSHTMFGPCEGLGMAESPQNGDNAKKRKATEMASSSPVDPESRGIIPRAVERLFEETAELSKKGWEYMLKVSMLEIYNEVPRCLLRSNAKGAEAPELKISLDPKSGRTVCQGQEVVTVASPNEVYQLLRVADENRAWGKTGLNDRSSRSHTIFQICIEGKREGESLTSMLNLCDLAGSERCEKSKTTDSAFKETLAINSSLTALVSCIHSIAQKNSHINFRDSVLTRILQDSLIGTAKTLFLTTVATEPENYQETINTVRFAQKLRACELKGGEGNKKAKLKK